METFTALKALTENPQYENWRKKSLTALNHDMIDAPIVEIIQAFNKLPFCFTLQSCYGHFLYSGQKNPYNLEPLPATKTIPRVTYRIAYLAFCIENSASGKRLLENLNAITAIDSENIQLCCAEWFWKRQVNSYALQVEPDRFKHEDTAILDYKEALYIEKTRNEFFAQIKALLGNLKS